LIVENRVDAGRDDVGAELWEIRAVVAQQKPGIGQERAQLFHCDRQQKIVAQIAAAVVSGKKYGCAVTVAGHGGEPRTQRRPAIDPSKS